MVRLSPQDRREALIAATLPLLRAQGLQVSTRQIAEAARVAEGTIFRVFPDKPALIRAALERLCDPAPIAESLRNLPDALDLRTKLGIAARIISKRFSETMPLILAMRSGGMVTVHAGAHSHDHLEMIGKAVARLLEPDRDRLLHTPETIARMLTAVVMTQPRLPVRDVVSVLLDGVLRPEKKKTEPACS